MVQAEPPGSVDQEDGANGQRATTPRTSFAPEPVATSRRAVLSGTRSPARGRRSFGARSGWPATLRRETRAWVSAAVAARSRANTIARGARGRRTVGKGRSLSARVRCGAAANRRRVADAGVRRRVVVGQARELQL